MKYVSEVDASVKGMSRTPLDRRTLLVGGNSAGKTARVNAIELALSGSASEIQGRRVVRESNTLLSLGNSEELDSTVTVEDDDLPAFGKARISGKMKGKKWMWTQQPPGIYNPESVFPLRSVQEALAGGVETIRKFFLTFAGLGGIDDSPSSVTERVPGPLQELWRSIMPDTESAVHALLVGLSSAEEKLREARAEAKTRVVVVNESGAGLPPPPSSEAIAEAKRAVSQAQAALERHLVRSSEAEVQVKVQAARRKAEDEKVALEKKIEELTADVERLEAELLDMSPPSEFDGLRQAQLQLLRHSRDKNLAKCVLCTHESGPTIWTGRVEKVEQQAQKREVEIKAYDKLASQLLVANSALGRAQEELVEVKEDIAAFPPPPTEAQEDLALALSDARANVDSATTHLNELVAREAQWSTVKKSRDSAVAAEQRISNWVLLVDHLKIELGSALGQGVEIFEQKVQAHLPGKYKFGLQLVDAGREVCRYGWRQADGTIHPAVGGGEWAMLLTAMSSALIPSWEKDLLHIVIPPDCGWDADTLAEACEALSEAPGQVIFPTTTYPSRVPSGWTVVELGDVSATKRGGGGGGAGGGGVKGQNAPKSKVSVKLPQRPPVGQKKKQKPKPPPTNIAPEFQ